MCNEAVVENGGASKFVPDNYKNQKMCNQTVNNYADALEYVFKTQDICDKAVDNYPSAIQCVPECFKTQEMFDKAVDTCPVVFDSVLY